MTTDSEKNETNKRKKEEEATSNPRLSKNQIVEKHQRNKQG
jgi:hypothetical protein